MTLKNEYLPMVGNESVFPASFETAYLINLTTRINHVLAKIASCYIKVEQFVC
jgi:hypothetical protein